MKKYENLAVVLKKIGIKLLLIVGFLVIPLVFCAIFRSDEYSMLLGFISCNMSSEHWFSFWITYLAAISSAAVALFSLRLTKKAEEIQLENKLGEDRLKFKILKIQETSNVGELLITLPLEVVSISHTVITYASISFGGGECVVLFESQNENDVIPLKGCTFSLMYPKEMEKSGAQAFQWWYRQHSTRSRAYLYAELNILFEYPLTTLGKNTKNQLVCSKARISIKLDDTGKEDYDIADQAVYNPKDKQYIYEI